MAELLNQPKHLYPNDYEEQMTWRIRWYLIVAITVAYALSLLGGLIASGLVISVKSRSYTHLVKDELARSPVIGKDPITLGTADLQARLAEEKSTVFCRKRERSLPQQTAP